METMRQKKADHSAIMAKEGMLPGRYLSSFLSDDYLML